jgi:hypothetical protein
MLPYKKITIFSVLLIAAVTSCTKLDEKLQSTLTYQQAATLPTSLLLQAAYVDIGAPFTNQDQVFSLQENSTDESLVPTRGGDWDDNGVWRVLHNHSWNADHGQILTVFNNLNKLQFDATNVLAFTPTPLQAAEARFLRAFALYSLFDLYGQYPYREPSENLLNAPVVKTGAAAIDFIISELTAILPTLGSGASSTANADACRFLLMRCYLNRGAFLNRAAPTFAVADMQQVITLGNAILGNTKYSYTPNYFDNFSFDNGVKSKEAIFAYANQSGVTAGNSGPQARWNMTLHYNSYGHPGQSVYGNAGWNGFSTISDFYTSFGVAAPTTFTPADTLLDRRLGGRFYQGVTNISGIRPGLLVGQQFDEKGVARVDRKGNPLAFTPTIAPTMIESGTNLEVTGIRVVKYPPDFSDTTGKYYGGTAGNWIMLFRYADAALMVAEAKMRSNTDIPGAMTLINALRTARGASVIAGTLPLVNVNNVDDPNTLLAERGRELYWEGVRRTDLIRFGVYLKPWGLKPTDDPKYLLYPVPTQALAANPNLKQNAGY